MERFGKMAVTMVMKDDIKIDRVNLIKTVVSHGWDLHMCIQDDSNKIHNQIRDAKIYNYLIRARTKFGYMLVICQPSMNQMTIVGIDEDAENKMKQEIANIIGKNKKGAFWSQKDVFLEGILYHKRFLTEKEILSIASECDKTAEDINYIH